MNGFLLKCRQKYCFISNLSIKKIRYEKFFLNISELLLHSFSKTYLEFFYKNCTRDYFFVTLNFNINNNFNDQRTLSIFAYVHILDLIALKSIFNEEFKYVIYIVLRPSVESQWPLFRKKIFHCKI
jgi:hypothetical protein